MNTSESNTFNILNLLSFYERYQQLLENINTTMTLLVEI